MAHHNQQHLIELDGNKPLDVLLDVSTSVLLSQMIQRNIEVVKFYTLLSVSCDAVLWCMDEFLMYTA